MLIVVLFHTRITGLLVDVLLFVVLLGYDTVVLKCEKVICFVLVSHLMVLHGSRRLVSICSSCICSMNSIVITCFI